MELLQQVSSTAWQVAPTGGMRVPAVMFATADLIRSMDDKVFQQITNVAALPGIVRAAYVMPDAHWGYGFPIGGVAAFDADAGGVLSAGGVGFDISCGVRTHLTGLPRRSIEARQSDLADALYRQVPVGVGAEGKISLDNRDTTAMLTEGAAWALDRGWGRADDLDRIEEGGRCDGADPAAVSEQARRRQRREMGTLGSGNHYLEVQEIAEIFDQPVADIYGLKQGECVVTIHCGSRGLGHQIGTEFLSEMAETAEAHGIQLPDRELACAPINSQLGPGVNPLDTRALDWAYQLPEPTHCRSISALPRRKASERQGEPGQASWTGNKWPEGKKAGCEGWIGNLPDCVASHA